MTEIPEELLESVSGGRDILGELKDKQPQTQMQTDKAPSKPNAGAEARIRFVVYSYKDNGGGSISPKIGSHR